MPIVVPGVSGVVSGVLIVVPGVSTTGVVVASGVGVTEASDSSEEAALESLEVNSDASELDTAGSVAVATMLESSSLKDDPMLAKGSGVVAGLAADGAASVSVRIPPTPPVTSERAEVRAPEPIGRVAEDGVGRIPPRPVSEALESLGLAGVGSTPPVT